MCFSSNHGFTYRDIQRMVCKVKLVDVFGVCDSGFYTGLFTGDYA